MSEKARKYREGPIVACLILSGAIWLSAGCGGWAPVPDQSQFAPLESLRDSGLAVVRLYAAPMPGLEGIAIHPWFVLKRAGSPDFDRWEVWPEVSDRLSRLAEDRYGHVYLNLAGPTAGAGVGGAHILAELIGPEAEPVIAFIESRSPSYPSRHHYLYFPGPNSSTYAQWVLDCAGWDVTLPPTAIGKGIPPV